LQQLQWKEQGKEDDHTHDEDEEDLKYNGNKNRQAVARDCQEQRKTVLEAKVHNRLQCLRSRSRNRRQRRRRRRRIIIIIIIIIQGGVRRRQILYSSINTDMYHFRIW